MKKQGISKAEVQKIDFVHVCRERKDGSAVAEATQTNKQKENKRKEKENFENTAASSSDSRGFGYNMDGFCAGNSVF